MLQNPPMLHLLLLLPIPMCSLIPTAAFCLSSSTFRLSDRKFFFVSCTHQQRCIYSLHCLFAFSSYSTLILHVSSLPVNLPASDFYKFSFLALSCHSCHLTFLLCDVSFFLHSYVLQCVKRTELWSCQEASYSEEEIKVLNYKSVL